jgi:hypothetical protein
MECVIETKASMVLDFIAGLRGDLQVTFEEGTSAAWLYDLLKPHVTKLVVCDPRKNASMREGNQSDKIDARRLAEQIEHTIVYLHLSRKHLTAVANPLDTIDVSRPESATLSRKLQKR